MIPLDPWAAAAARNLRELQAALRCDHAKPIDRVTREQPLAEQYVAPAAGRWLVDKARRQARTLGTQQAARNLKKQGVPLHLALSILATRQQPV